MAYKIGLLGLGTVGTGTAQILLDPTGRHPLLEAIQIQRVGVRNPDKVRQVDFSAGMITTDLQAITTDPEIDIVVELIGGLEPARSLILTAIAHGKHIVTANKAVIARFGPEIYAAANEAGVYVMLEAAVGGGIPIIKPLKQSLGANRIHSIMGIVNGTTNYILTQMTQAGADFDPVLTAAQELGYAEADPSADVDGWDAADKIAILASLAFGGRVDREAVYCEGIRDLSLTDITYAEKLGFVIKLLAIAQQSAPERPNQLELRVHPTLLPKAHPLASINDVYNAILVTGDPLGQVMFFGPGAGRGPTASAVIADILNIVGVLESTGPSNLLDPLLSCSTDRDCDVMAIETVRSRFYARFLSRDIPGVIGFLGSCFGEYQVSLESVVQTGFQNKLAEIVVVTHEVTEADFREAIAKIQSLEAIHSVPQILRVL